MLDKDKIFLIYTEIEARVNRGDYWVGQIRRFFKPENIAIYSTFFLLWFPNIDKVMLVSTIIFITAAIEIPKYFIGKWDEKKLGFWKKQSEYGQKKEHISPSMVEIREQLKEHTKILSKLAKVKIKNHIKDL